MYVANAAVGETSTWALQRSDLWELQQDIADYIGDELGRYYDGRDWTGRKAVYDEAMDRAFRMGEGVDSIELPNGCTITIKTEDDEP